FAATVAWEWCRHKGDHFTLAVTGAAPVVLGGMTGSDHALRMLEVLAGLQGEDDPDPTKLLERLAARPLPAACALGVGSRAAAPPPTAPPQSFQPPAPRPG